MPLNLRIETLIGPLLVAIFTIALGVPCLCAPAEASEPVSSEAEHAETSCDCSHGDEPEEEQSCCCGCDAVDSAPDVPLTAENSAAMAAGDLRLERTGTPLVLELPEPGHLAAAGVSPGPVFASAGLDRAPPHGSLPEHPQPTYLRVQTLRI
ncbi:hypothetical protein DL240_06450 [Lujinxingia litoralis]|uniref:Uncharacterized protein n=1 Tax=Lujinxingia litoralis TaxID=2211119 RepID=A0A328C895_9DELT|nr:hypothetical protein [Lujinxingia litoralis]RAL23790.1 hypothetical protein DL240_06450 [Lujinxingia litoralis]